MPKSCMHYGLNIRSDDFFERLSFFSNFNLLNDFCEMQWYVRKVCRLTVNVLCGRPLEAAQLWGT